MDKVRNTVPLGCEDREDSRIIFIVFEFKIPFVKTFQHLPSTPIPNPLMKTLEKD